jgi:hypothetical protein
MAWITAALSLIARIPGLGKWLERLGLVAGTAIVMRREQRHAQELADAKAKMDMAESRERVRDPGVVHELRRRHTRPE